MPQTTHLEIVSAETERLEPPQEVAAELHALRGHARRLAGKLVWVPGMPSSRTFAARTRALAKAIKPLAAALEQPLPDTSVSDDFRWLYDNLRLIYTEV